MTKGGKLIWELFAMLREVASPSAANSKRQSEWAKAFAEMEKFDEPEIEVTNINAGGDIADHPAGMRAKRE